jgi:hypothetical protein
MPFVILAKLLTQTNRDEIDYLLKNLTAMNFLSYFFIFGVKITFFCSLQEKLNLKDLKITLSPSI